jgi:hypothetical protein
MFRRGVRLEQTTSNQKERPAKRWARCMALVWRAATGLGLAVLLHSDSSSRPLDSNCRVESFAKIAQPRRRPRDLVLRNARGGMFGYSLLQEG